MTDWYVDYSKITAGDYNSAPTAAGTVPAKGEDGNGKAIGVASMATLVLNFTGLPTATQTITICGVTFTAVASGAAGNQFNIGGTAAITAGNLQTAINASATNAVNPALISCPLKNAINACISGSVVTVYTRICGSEWNSVTEASTLSNVTVTQWSGGTDGAWGYPFNITTITWPTNAAVGAYGALPGTYLGTPNGNDVIWCRSRRSGVDIGISMSANVTVNPRNIGTQDAPVWFKIDDGTKWSGDVGTFTVSVASGTSTNFNLGIAGSGHWRFVGKVTNLMNNGSSNFKFVYYGVFANYGIWLYLPSATQWGYEGIEINDTMTGTNVTSQCTFMGNSPGNANGVRASYVRGCIIRQSKTQASLIWYNGSTPYQNCVRFIDCECIFTGQTTSNLNVLANWAGVSAPWNRVDFERCKLTGLYNGANKAATYTQTQNYALVVTDCEMGNLVGLAGTLCGIRPPNVEAPDGSGPVITVTNAFNDRQFLFETTKQVIEWRAASFPTRNAKLPDNVTPYCVRMSGPPNSGAFALSVTKESPLRSLRMSKINSLADGTRTLQFDLLIDQNFGATTYNDECWIEGLYQDTSSAIQRFTTKCGAYAPPTALSAGNSSEWSFTTYTISTLHTYNPVKLTTTLTNAKGGTEVALKLCFAKNTTSANDWIFMDPEFGLT